MDNQSDTKHPQDSSSSLETSQGTSVTLDAYSQQSDSFYQDWLDSQCSLIDGAQSALVLAPLDEDDNTYHPMALWPQDSGVLSDLHGLAEEIITNRSALVTALPASVPGYEVFAIGYPIILDDELIAVATVAVAVSSEQQLKRAMQLLELGGSALEVLKLRLEKQQRSAKDASLERSIDFLASVQSEPDYASSAMRLVTELAVMLNCDRVSLGNYQKGHSKVLHLSHSTQFGKRMNLIRCIEEVMDEAIDQQQSVVYPNPDLESSSVVIAHSKLSQQQGDAVVLSVPLYVANDIVGALTFERNPDIPFTEQDVALCESIAALVIPALEDKRLNDRALLLKVWDSGKTQFARLFGPGYLGRKLLFILSAVLIIFFSVAQGSYRLSADAKLDSYIQRVIAAPYDGYIHSAVHRAGDVVKKDQMLVQLDDRDLHLERLKWLSEEAKLNRQYQEALAFHDRAKLNIINAQQTQIKAQLDLVNSQLERAKLLSPFDGLIVSGDLSQRLGGAVQKGEVLFEVSPLHFYRINLLVKESRIADVLIGQDGTLHLSALPETPFEFVVTKITPLTEAKDGATFFVVEASLQGESLQLQPGMEGVGKIYIDERNLLSIWTREMQEWMRLKVWSWWG
ncbi:efflux RND transporter periplasmic adaptor subunit [Neptuniibacter sp. QD37_11]|uniref:efflux RND transporter periplasmic adaptor subunit n=1 Tax=Neptuniibacter sp. QD37_11 TaxID=3398209 RepID=UPI0039F528B5